MGSDDGTAEAIRLAYNRSAAAWMSGPDTLYGRLAEALLTAAPLPMAGARVLDLGAGTGVAGRAAIAAGARQVVAVDIAESMLRAVGGSSGRMLPVVADATHLPFTAQAFDIVCAAFCLGHLPDPVAALKEARRVGRTIVASAFAAGWTHPAKAAVDDALGEFGYSAPARDAGAPLCGGRPAARPPGARPAGIADRSRRGRISARPARFLHGARIVVVDRGNRRRPREQPPAGAGRGPGRTTRARDRPAGNGTAP